MDAFEFTYPLGHRDVNHYQQNPPNEETWRDYLNEMPFEIRQYLNDVVKSAVETNVTNIAAAQTTAANASTAATAAQNGVNAINARRLRNLLGVSY